jgi:hypothetical protein
MLSIALPALTHADWHVRRTGLMFLGCSAEGTCMTMRESFDEILPAVLALAKDSVPYVREAVGLCLAMFSEHLPQSILARDAAVMPVVFTMLDDTDAYVVEKV